MQFILSILLFMQCVRRTHICIMVLNRTLDLHFVNL
jgi:hypothetical protein